MEKINFLQKAPYLILDTYHSKLFSNLAFCKPKYEYKIYTSAYLGFESKYVPEKLPFE